MKIAIYVIMLIALALVIFNLTKVDWESPFTGDSTVAFIGVLASLCVIALMLILIISRKIAKKKK